MAVVYKGEIMSNRAVKQKIKKDNRLSIKEQAVKEGLFRKKIRFIGPKPKLDLFEGKIIADLGENYKVMVKSRNKKSDQEYKIMIESKKRVYFKK